MQQVLAPLHLSVQAGDKQFTVKKGNKTIKIHIISSESTQNILPGELAIPIDYLVKSPVKVAAIIQSKLGLNIKVFGRNCEVKKINKKEANAFIDAYHLMNSTQSAFNAALYNKNELLAVASFSKGRKMRRLNENQRSYELIRFCSKSGYTITGGLSKLLKFFIKEKHAGDIMTYVDQLWSDGDAFVKAGFIHAEKMPPKTFYINKKNFERKEWKNNSDEVNSDLCFLIKDAGNLKMIYTPIAKH